MSCIHISTCQLASSPSPFSAQSFRLKASICPSIYLGTKFPKVPFKLAYATSQYQRAPVVCLFGGKGKSENGNEVSPWKALENAVGNFRKNQSIEDVLKQQIEKGEYYDDGGTSGKPPGGGGNGGSDGFGEAEDEGFSGMWDEFVQVILATTGIIFLYIYILENEEINVIARDLIRLLFTRQKSLRLNRLINQWKSFIERMKEREDFDPYWLEREILSTPTWYDSPAKYNYIINALISRSRHHEDAGDYDDDDNDDIDDNDDY